MNYKGTYQPCVRNLPLDECIVNTNTWTAWAKEKEEEKTKSSPKWPKAREKPKQGHLKWATLCKNLVPKDMDNVSMQPSTTQLTLKKRQQNELNTASKAGVSEQMGVIELNTIKRDSKVLVPPERGKRLNTTSKLKCAKLPLEKISQLPLIKCIVKHQSNKEKSPPCLTSAHNKN